MHRCTLPRVLLTRSAEADKVTGVKSSSGLSCNVAPKGSDQSLECWGLDQNFLFSFHASSQPSTGLPLWEVSLLLLEPASGEASVVVSLQM